MLCNNDYEAVANNILHRIFNAKALPLLLSVK